MDVKRTPSLRKNEISRHRLSRDASCINCGMCVTVCPSGVHERRDGYSKVASPYEYLCKGKLCNICVETCSKGALSKGVNPMIETLGDYRWTADLLMTGWERAETGKPPTIDMEKEIGNSGGGFDKMSLNYIKDEPEESELEGIDISVELNRRADGPRVKIGVPFYCGGMSFGSVSLATILSMAMAAAAKDTFTCTGEGGYPDVLYPYKDNVITQVATGLFGVREETIKRSRIIEFKYAQGAKPGLGGHLLGSKVTDDVARMREVNKGTNLFSPFPFHSVYSIEDHRKHVDWIKHINPSALVSVKVSTPADVDMVALGSYYAGANIVHLDGGYGGTGAAPEIAKKNIAMPIEYGIPKVHKFLTEEGARDDVTLIASGGIRTPYDIAKAIALGADGVVIGTALIVAIGCVRCGHCEIGCARGIATTDASLILFNEKWGAQRIFNLFSAWEKELKVILYRLGLNSISELTGRWDLISHTDHPSTKGGEAK